ncbi:MAG: bifunctional DNA-formamidopyrimidine glycosylase/DNA-(apurinic or apyrimidinic site) lyase [Patescibacteria group bacterium]
MPELPEVETTVRGLRKKLLGLRFRDVWSDREKAVRQAGGVTLFNKAIKGKKVLKVWRRAKFIVIDIEGPKSIFIHQKISGHLMYGRYKLIGGVWKSTGNNALKTDPKNQHIRVVFNLSNGYQMALSDVRRFGKVMLVDDKAVDNLKEISLLGPEPLDISYEEFKKLFDKKRGRIKQVIMDPYFIVGIGNIYADEILWQVGLHPTSRVENLDAKYIKKIYIAMQEILKLSIKLKGSSMDDYRTPTGEKGSYQNIHKAYHRTGEKCLKKDGGIMERLVLGGRSGHFCPVHQVVK